MKKIYSKSLLLFVGFFMLLALIACDNNQPTQQPDDPTDGPTEVTPQPTVVAEKIKDFEDRNVDLMGEDLVNGSQEVVYTLSDYVKNVSAQGTTFELASSSEGVTLGTVKNNKVPVTVSTVGDKEFSLKVSNATGLLFEVKGKIHVTDSSVYYIENGGFETGDLTGWTVSDDSGFVVADNEEYFNWLDPVPTTNHTGDYYLDGFNQANGFSGEAKRGTLTSSPFVVGGSRWVSFQLGGGNQKSLRLELVAKEGDVVIAVFNNYMFKDPERSIGLTTYAYQVPAEYAEKECYFRFVDNATSGSFQAFTADTFITYYAVGSEPVVDNENIFAANYSGTINSEKLNLSAATATLKNGGFETGNLEGWTGGEGYTLSTSETFFEAFFPDNIPTYNKVGTYFLTTETNYDFQGTLTSEAFVVSGSGWITLKIGGNKTDNLYVSLMKYVEDGEDIEIARFNNNLFSDPYRSFAMTKYAYQIPAEHMGSKCYFVICDYAASDTSFGAMVVDDIQTYYEVGNEPVVDGIDCFYASYCQVVPTGIGEKLGLDSATNEIRNGGFETGDLTGWFSYDLGESYVVTTEGTLFEQYYPYNAPIYNVTGDYFLTGFKAGEAEGGLNAVGAIYSQAFIVGGTRWITFKLGGTNNEAVALELYAYNEVGEDTLIAQFNNYLFSDPYRSIGMTTYGYQIPQEYAGRACYFKIVDQANNSIAFGAIAIDDVKTYYETAPVICTENPLVIYNDANSPKLSDDTNIYEAAYVNKPIDTIADKLGIDTATNELRNGGFETGDLTGWFTDAAGVGSYVISSATTYFEAFFPDNIPNYNKEGTYFLDGYGNEGYTGSVYSQAFVVGGSRWITFRLGGNKTEGLKVKLMKYVDGVNDVEIAVFNNYLFSDPYRSFGMTEYGYQIPEEYMGAHCYFVIEDYQNDSNFKAITADAFVTYYENAPTIYYGSASDNISDGRIYLAGYMYGNN